MVLLKHNLQFKSWNSHVHLVISRNFESTNLSRDNLSREIGRRVETCGRALAGGGDRQVDGGVVGRADSVDAWPAGWVRSSRRL